MGVGLVFATAALGVADGVIVAVHVPPLKIVPHPVNVIEAILTERDVGHATPIAVSGPVFWMVKTLGDPELFPVAVLSPVTLKVNVDGVTDNVVVFGARVTSTFKVSAAFGL